MGKVYAILFVTAVIGLCSAQNEVAEKETSDITGSNVVGPDILEKLQYFKTDFMAFDAMCAKQCPDNPKRFSDTLDEVKICAMSVDRDQETWCSWLRKSFMNCTYPAQKFLEECFTDEATRSLPNHIFKAVLSGMDYICDIDGEHIFELLNPCARGISYTSVCGRKLVSTRQRFDETLPTKEELCSFFDAFKPCVNAQWKTSCENEITQETWIGLYDAVARPCNADEESTELDTNDK